MNLAFNEAYNYDIIYIYKVLLLYELTCHKVSLLYEFTFLIMLHIKHNIVKDVVFTLGTRCVK